MGKVKVMHISIANILEMMTDSENIIIIMAIEYEVMHWRSIGIFTFDLDPL